MERKKREIKRQIIFERKTCGKVFEDKKACKSRTPKFCSLQCFGKSIQKEKYCPICGVHVSWVNKTYCSIKCRSIWRTGRKASPEAIEKMSLAKKGKKIPHLHKPEIVEKIRKSLKGRPNHNMRGKNHPNYKDGGAKTSERLFEMGRIEYKNWRRSVFERDDFKCVICGIRGKKLNADHIKPWSMYPELRYDINNGRTLCVQCHRNTNTFGFSREMREMSNLLKNGEIWT